jgi:putative copper export protein
MTPDLVSVAVRALACIALFQAAGAALFLLVFGNQLTKVASMRRLGLISAAVGVALTIAHLSLDAARMAGDFHGLLDPDLQKLAWESKSGASALVQIAGLLVILVALRLPTPAGFAWAGLGAAAAVGGFLLAGHTTSHAPRAALAPLLGLHLLVGAFWFGSLLPLMFVVRDESGATAASVLKGFSVIAGRVVPLILLAGLGMAWMLAGSIGIIRMPYGELLVAKMLGFTLLMLLASFNKWRFVPALAAGEPATPLYRSIVAEYALIAAVLSVTAVLTTFYSPK